MILIKLILILTKYNLLKTEFNSKSKYNIYVQLLQILIICMTSI